MRKLRCLLVDDENDSRIVLKDLLRNFCQEAEVIGEASNFEDAYVLINEKSPDLVFLDIQMPTGNGFMLLRKFEKIPFEVIFVTSYDKYAINAIKFSALDYLLKPVAIHDLQNSVKKAYEKLESKKTNQNLILNLLQSVDDNESEKKIALHKNDSVRFVKVRNILYIESDWNYSNIYTSTNEEYTSSKTLKEFEEYLLPFSFFIRIHKNCLVNVNHIREYSKGEPCIITMQDGKELEISRRKKQEVLVLLKEFKM
ncbi:MAG: LytR/AlgR family response regulator transcription factor [Bacteroidia bacterium]